MYIIRTIWNGIRNFHKSPKKWILTLCLSAVLIALALYHYDQRQKTGVSFDTMLDETAVKVGDQTRTFREVAFYVAYEESQVDEQARVYNPQNPEKYWNVHVDGVFVRLAARNACAQMALHDEIFYQMAMNEKITLNEEDRRTLSNYQKDVWNDLKEDDRIERLGVSKEDIDATLERMSYAQKMQLIYAGMNGVEYEDYDFSAPGYENLLKEWEGEINKAAWKQLEFGSITLSYE